MPKKAKATTKVAEKAKRAATASMPKKRDRPARKTPDLMDLSELRSYIDSLEAIFAKKVREQKRYLETQLSAISGYVVDKSRQFMRAMTADGATGRKGTRGKVAPKYQSKDDPSQKWSGRGGTPRWMVAEMKEHKLKKEDFLIK